eukprot:68473-Pleurochrysis_carterae.AAC.2
MKARLRSCIMERVEGVPPFVSLVPTPRSNNRTSRQQISQLVETLSGAALYGSGCTPPPLPHWPALPHRSPREPEASNRSSGKARWA